MVATAHSKGKARAGGTKKTARLWWNVHQWVGLKLSLLLSFVLLTGTLAVFGDEIDWLLQPAKRVDPATVSGPVNWPAIAQAAAAYAPDAEIQWIESSPYESFAARVTIIDAERKYGFLYAHPTTGEVLGEGPWVGAQRILRNMHRTLMMPTFAGIIVVSSLSFLLIVSFVTSFVVYKKWWRGFFRPIRLRDARTAWGDFHRLAGLWSMWFLLLIAVTGLWYLVEVLGGRAPALPSARVEASISDAAAADALASSLQTALAAYPDLKVNYIVFPGLTGGPFLLQGEGHGILVRRRANAVWTEAETGELLLVTDARDLNLHQRISEAADPLHFGNFGGLATKVIWFVFGAFLTGLSLSGCAIYALRLVKADRTGQNSHALPKWWQGMGFWRWLAAGLIAWASVMLGIFVVVGQSA